jgi:hypothetical protein
MEKMIAQCFEDLNDQGNIIAFETIGAIVYVNRSNSSG